MSQRGMSLRPSVEMADEIAVEVTSWASAPERLVSINPAVP